MTTTTKARGGAEPEGPSIGEAMGEAYEDARDDAMRETDLPRTAFPVLCAYDWETILKREIEFDDLRSPEG
jgi:hypothetical protein